MFSVRSMLSPFKALARKIMQLIPPEVSSDFPEVKVIVKRNKKNIDWIVSFCTISGTEALSVELAEAFKSNNLTAEVYKDADTKQLKAHLQETLMAKFRSLCTYDPSGNEQNVDEDGEEDERGGVTLVRKFSLSPDTLSRVDERHFKALEEIVLGTLRKYAKAVYAKAEVPEKILRKEEYSKFLPPRWCIPVAGVKDGGKEPTKRKGINEDRAVDVLGIKLAPLFGISMQGRMESFCVFMFTFGHAYPLAIMAFLVYNWRLFWPFILAYLTYIYWDQKRIKRGEFHTASDLWRNNFVMRTISSYFPVRIILNSPTSSFDSSRSYLMGLHPHGIIGVSAITGILSEGAGWSKKFPGLITRVCSLNINMWFPFFREWFLRCGGIGVSAPMIKNAIKGAGKACVVVLGGAAEALDAAPGKILLTIRRRSGFFRIALETGTPLVPIFAFGENDLFDTRTLDDDHPIRKFQVWMYKRITFCLPIFHGRTPFTYNFGLMPYRRPIHIIVGDPIDVQKVESPSKEEVEKLKEKYIESLRELYQKWQPKVDPGRDVQLIIT